MVQPVERYNFGSATLLDADTRNCCVIVPVMDMVPWELVQEGLEQNVNKKPMADHGDSVLRLRHFY